MAQLTNFRARWALRQSLRLPGGLQPRDVAPHPRLQPLLRRNVQQNLARPQDHPDDQGGGQNGESLPLASFFTFMDLGKLLIGRLHHLYETRCECEEDSFISYSTLECMFSWYIR